MSDPKIDLINYRIERSMATPSTARPLIEDEDWFGAANRLYYAPKLKNLPTLSSV